MKDSVRKKLELVLFGELSIILCLMIFAIASPAKAQDLKTASLRTSWTATCTFSSIGWAKYYGKNSIEKKLIISGSSINDLSAKCKTAAAAYVDVHIGEGDVAVEKIGNVKFQNELLLMVVEN